MNKPDNQLLAALRDDCQAQWARASSQLLRAATKYARDSRATARHARFNGDEPPSDERSDDLWMDCRDWGRELYACWREWSPLLGRQMPETGPAGYRLDKAALSLFRWESREREPLIWANLGTAEVDRHFEVWRLRQSAVLRAIHELAADEKGGAK